MKYELSELDLPIVGDGGIFASLNDVMRWQELFFSGQIVSPAMTKYAATGGLLDNGESLGYGCGLMVEPVDKGEIWCGHTGGWHGTATILGRYMAEGLTVAVLSNDQLAPVARIAEYSARAWRNQA
jgi:CubicO group peptidase (beta-lactamase class C family)